MLLYSCLRITPFQATLEIADRFGLVDTLGRAFLPDLLRLVLSTTAASTLARALSSMLIYLLMAIVLAIRPQGLFPVVGR